MEAAEQSVTEPFCEILIDRPTVNRPRSGICSDRPRTYRMMINRTDRGSQTTMNEMGREMFPFSSCTLVLPAR